MARTARRLIYMEPELDQKVRERAEKAGVSVNQWFTLIAEHYLAERGVALTYTETKTTKVIL